MGIDYLANNQGVVKDVTVRSGDGGGYCGLLMARYAPGPALIKRVRIEGFDTGIRLGQLECSMTLEHITLVGQSQIGIDLAGNVLNIRDLASSNSVPVVRCRDNAQLTLVDGVFTGGTPACPAITNQAKLYLRNITSAGYGKIVAPARGYGSEVAGGEGPTHLAEYATQRVISLFPSPLCALRLPVEESPEFHTNDFSQWASVVAFGATPNNSARDDAAGIQAAIDSGKPIVYLPRGEYTVSRPIILRGAVRKFAGLHSYLGTNSSFRGGALIRFEGGSADACIVEHLRLNGGVEHASAQTLSLRHTEVLSGGYRNTITGTGRMFIEDTVLRPVLVNYPQQLWARQLNPENGSMPLVENHGGVVWILGLKTEGPVTVVKTVRGFTQVVGGLTYPTRAVPSDIPLYINEEGGLTFTHLVTQQDWPLWVRETRNGLTRNLRNSTACFRGVPLYAGYQDELRLQSLCMNGAGGFILQTRALPGRTYAIEMSEDLARWQAIETNSASGLPFVFTDNQACTSGFRVYRARPVGD